MHGTRRAGAAMASLAVRGGGTAGVRTGAAQECGKAHQGGHGLGRLGNEDVPRMVTAAGRARR